MDPADRKNYVLRNREWLLHPLKASVKVWQIYEGTEVASCSLWEKKVFLHVKAQRLDSGWAGLLPTGDPTAYSLKEELSNTNVA